jgi:hypothetical protein
MGLALRAARRAAKYDRHLGLVDRAKALAPHLRQLRRETHEIMSSVPENAIAAAARERRQMLREAQ